MSYMNDSSAFAPAAGIQELSLDEIEQTNGGVPMLVGVAIAIYGPTVLKATVATVSLAGGAGLIWYAAHN